MIDLQPLELIASVAEDQWGLVTRRQADRLGVTRKAFENLSAPGRLLVRIASGVYRLVGTPVTEHFALKAAWLQLDPGIFAYERTFEQGVVSHRSAAAVFQIGHLPEQSHEFTVSRRRQTRRPDVRLHLRRYEAHECTRNQGLLLTRPARIAADLLAEREDPGAVGHLIADVLRRDLDQPDFVARSIAPHALNFGLRRSDGLGLLRWLLELVGDPAIDIWLQTARVALQVDEVRDSPSKESNAQ